MKQYDLQGNEYDIQIKSMLDAMPKDIESCTIHFTEKDLLEGFREETLRHRKEIERLNNIINGIEQYIKYYVMNNFKFDNNTANIILDQLEKLKEE